MGQSLESSFQQICAERKIAVTHQRLVLYRAVMQMLDHPNPEQIYERVRQELPSISLATVYKTLQLFLQHGIVCEVSPHHGSLRIDPNTSRHHHFVCLRCRCITDLEESDDVVLPMDSVPEGYHVEQVTMELRGICGRCAADPVRA